MKVKTYLGHDVPEGATHHSDGSPLDLFYRFNSHKEAFYFNGKWLRSNACAVYIKDNIIELPEEETKQDWDDAPEWADRLMQSKNGSLFFCSVEKYILTNGTNSPYATITFGATSDSYTIGEFKLIEMRQEIKPQVWMPAVGDECEVLILSQNTEKKWLKNTPAYLGRALAIMISANGGEWCHGIDQIQFRPLKTQEEIDREEFKARVEKILSGIHKDDFTPREAAAVLDECGFEMPRGDE